MSRLGSFLNPALGYLVVPYTRGFAAGGLKAISTQMKSVKSIQKLTKAMKMVAAAKLKADQRRLDAGLPFSKGTQELMQRLPIESHPIPGDCAIVSFSSDKGLCGGVNSAIAKATRRLIQENESAGYQVQIYGIGDKIRAALQRLYGDRLALIINEVTKYNWNFGTAAILAERLIMANPSKMIFIYNSFRSMIAYDTYTTGIVTERQAEKMNKHELDGFEFEPERKDVWPDFHNFYYASVIHGFMLDSIASEQSARMNAMDSASKNAGELLDALTLKFNRARQAKITLELIEIIAGAEAL